ncbi:type II toxin-antitoxin system VapC family toxin [Rhizobium sp. SGZ-381]|uniref:type II toxin-antitoxin system VapC family toxin n=1 Tax=Rhizobium sp. SGZ-381 TaxID=3342800 RepID=UPI00366B5380
MARLLLDTHFVLAAADGVMAEKFPRFYATVVSSVGEVFVSTASLWEMAIKTRIGKLAPPLPLNEIPAYLEAAGFILMGIEVEHVLTAAHPEPPTRDPFDRLLLAQAQVEKLQLVTIDRALVGHPLAFRL